MLFLILFGRILFLINLCFCHLKSIQIQFQNVRFLFPKRRSKFPRIRKVPFQSLISGGPDSLRIGKIRKYILKKSLSLSSSVSQSIRPSRSTSASTPDSSMYSFSEALAMFSSNTKNGRLWHSTCSRKYPGFRHNPQQISRRSYYCN